MLATSTWRTRTSTSTWGCCGTGGTRTSEANPTRWWTGATHTRRVLNRLARRLRRANGELGQVELEASGGRCFAVGDRVVARMVARDLHVSGDADAHVRNGASGIVLAVDEAAGALDVDFEGIGVVRLPRNFIDEHAGPGGRRDVGLDHAYAVTSYAVQGSTFERSTSRIDVGATRSEAYVDITRGRQANHLFLTRAPDPLDGEHLPRRPTQTCPSPSLSDCGDLGPSGSLSSSQ